MALVLKAQAVIRIRDEAGNETGGTTMYASRLKCQQRSIYVQ
jgi:hypothetical protein